MTQTTARTVSNVVLASAGLAVAFVVLTTPPLRRLALAASERWLGSSVPGYLMAQVQHAWSESANLR